ncbi:MAG TPA: hypothetical protein VLH56_03410 [Dissulfurispiraceae bacterium]|nr:hypothetical protein [Dissulfurispiraceae bacterium]
MQATRTVAWETKNGKTATVEITKTRTVRDNIDYSDGWNVNLGKKTVDLLELVLRLDGKQMASSFNAPHIVTKAHYSNFDKIRAAGGYARLGDAYISEDAYTSVMAAITEAEAEAAGTEEFAAVKAEEAAIAARREGELQAEAAEYARLVKSGLCPKCQSWCHGDCTASQR